VHSLRAGLGSSAAAGGTSERAMMNQTGSPLDDHCAALRRAANLFAADNAANFTGL
jgi:hypothetical protein